MIANKLTALLVIAAAAVSAQPLSSSTTKRDGTASIVCQPKSEASWLYQGDAIYAGQGTLAGFKGERLSYDGRSGDLVPQQFQSSVCSSTALGLSVPDRSGSGYADPNPLKLFSANDNSQCLTLNANTETNTYLSLQECLDEDTEEAQATQFFLQHYKYRSIQPFGSKNSSGWSLQIYDSPSGYIIANPNTCPDGQTCQTDNQISLRI